MIEQISGIACEGISILFDYQTDGKSKETVINEQLASATGEQMKARYSYRKIEKLLSDKGFKIYEYLSDEDLKKDLENNFVNLKILVIIDNDRVVGIFHI